jgi:hypothetical protein
MSTRTGRRAHHPLARLLLDSIDDSVRGTVSASAYGGVDAAAVESAGFMHKVTPAVFVHLHGAGDAPPELIAPLIRTYHSQLVRHQHILEDLAGLATTLDDAGIVWATMKGPVLAERLWTRPDLRLYFDLDILVERRSFRETLGVLIDAGVAVLKQDWVFIENKTRAEVSLRLPKGTALDFHWHVVNDKRQRSQFTFPIAEMLSRTVHVKVGDATVPTLDPSDTLLHLAYHTAHSGGHRLMWLKDIERATANPELDWPQTLKRAHAYGVALPLAIVLARTGRVIGFECPPPRAAFAPARWSPWGVLTATVDQLRPPPVLPGDKHPAQMPFKNVRPSTLASVRPALSWLRERRIPAPEPTEGRGHSAGDDVALASYLATIEGAAEP